MSRETAALVLVLAYALLCAGCGWAYRRRRRRDAALAAGLETGPADAGPPLLVLHASQTGTATELALHTARALAAAGRPVRLAALGEVGVEALQAARRALLIVSTYGEGDPPDAAVPFARRDMARADVDLSHLSFGLLALGDQSYRHFAGFGRALDAWLLARGAKPLFPRLDADRADPAALAAWRAHIEDLGGAAPAAGAWAEAPFHPWRLIERERLDAGSPDAGLYRVVLAPAGEIPAWEAGDLAQIRPAGEDAARDYTVASRPADGRVELLVRRHRRPDGRPGAASGLLVEGLAPGASVPLRLRAHEAFRIGGNGARPLVLVGNGSGLAGLLAHLRARAAAGGPACWLVYGERRAAHDAHFSEDFARWQAAGVLARVDRVFSRDGGAVRYVQHLLVAEAARLREWVDAGAAVYVCGSQDGMAAGVDTVLRQTLGDGPVDGLLAAGRYRRDVY